MVDYGKCGTIKENICAKVYLYFIESDQFRDIQYIYSAFLTAWMYVTPIFYPLSQLPENLQTAIKTFNPLYTYITQFRTIVLDVACPDMGMVLYGFVVAFVTLGVGTLVFFKSQDRFILYI